MHPILMVVFYIIVFAILKKIKGFADWLAAIHGFVSLISFIGIFVAILNVPDNYEHKKALFSLILIIPIVSVVGIFFIDKKTNEDEEEARCESYHVMHNIDTLENIKFTSLRVYIGKSKWLKIKIDEQHQIKTIFIFVEAESVVSAVLYFDGKKVQLYGGNDLWNAIDNNLIYDIIFANRLTLRLEAAGTHDEEGYLYGDGRWDIEIPGYARENLKRFYNEYINTSKSSNYKSAEISKTPQEILEDYAYKLTSLK